MLSEPTTGSAALVESARTLSWNFPIEFGSKPYFIAAAILRIQVQILF